MNLDNVNKTRVNESLLVKFATEWGSRFIGRFEDVLIPPRDGRVCRQGPVIGFSADHWVVDLEVATGGQIAVKNKLVSYDPLR